jgi:hypothetical protein
MSDFKLDVDSPYPKSQVLRVTMSSEEFSKIQVLR